jgi:uncharacterized protein
MSTHRKLRLLTHPWRLVVERFDADARPATLLADAPPAGLLAVVRSPDSLTRVRVLNDGEAGEVWRAIEIAGSFAFTETGVLAAIAGPLAAAGISIFVVNSYETDFVLVHEEHLERARAVVAAAGHLLV